MLNKSVLAGKHPVSPVLITCLALALSTAAGGVAARSPMYKSHGAYCSRTAGAVFNACLHEVNEEHGVAKGNCLNVSAQDMRNACYHTARQERGENQALCHEQRSARKEVCADLGEDRYDPEIHPADFVDPLAIGDTIAPNPYFPLVPGLTRVYKSGTETITVVVTDETVEIQGVTAIVIHDLVKDGDEVIEDTRDWYAQDIHGNVWYLGESVQNFEDGFLNNLDGSFKAGDDAKAGILMKALPQVGDFYRQEFALGEAEDLAEVLSTTASEAAPAVNCPGSCLQTRDFTPLEPGVEEFKFYAPGIGPIVEYHTDDPSDRVELVEYHF